MGDATKVGEELASFAGVEHLGQLAGNDSHVGTHARPECVVRGVDNYADDLWRQVGSPAPHPMQGSLALRAAKWLIRRLQDGDEQQGDLMDAVGDEADAQ